MCESLEIPAREAEPIDRGLPYAHIYYAILNKVPKPVSESFLMFFKDYVFIRSAWKRELERNRALREENEQLKQLTQRQIGTYQADTMSPMVHDVGLVDETLNRR